MVCNGRSNSSVVMSSAMYQEIHLRGVGCVPAFLVGPMVHVISIDMSPGKGRTGERTTF